VPQSGRGFMRSNAGDWYSSNEWVFIDLRAARALELNGSATYAQSLFAWNVDQASDNFGELSELHDPVTADYAGQAPMVGFGAGAYLLRLYDRGSPGVPACGAYASEPALPSDGGVEGGAGGGEGTGGVDAGSGAQGATSASSASATTSGAGGLGAGGAGQGGAGQGGSREPSARAGTCGCSVPATPEWPAVAFSVVPLALALRRRRRA